MRFEDPASLRALVNLSPNIGYLIDVHDSSRRKDPAYRAKLIGSLKCAFGTLGGPQVEPPQHWPRERWFLPTVSRAARHLESLYSDGGRASEWFYHILANPADEISTWVVGRTLADPQTPSRKHLADSIDRIYHTRNSTVRDGLSEAFLAAEDAYTRYLSTDYCGTISLKTLMSNKSGPPIYLTRTLSPTQRAEYAISLRKARAQFATLGRNLQGEKRIPLILRTIDNVWKDIGSG